MLPKGVRLSLQATLRCHRQGDVIFSGSAGLIEMKLKGLGLVDGRGFSVSSGDSSPPSLEVNNTQRRLPPVV